MRVQHRCASCGKSYTTEAAANGGSLFCPTCSYRLAAPPAIPPTAKPSPHRPRSGRLLPGLFVGLIAAIMIGGLVAVVLLHHRSTESQTPLQVSSGPVRAAPTQPTTSPSPQAALADEVLSMKGEAESLALAGDLPAAAKQYRKIHALLDGHIGTDPILSDISAQISQGEDRIKSALKARQHPIASSAPTTRPTVARSSDSGSDFGTTRPAPPTQPAIATVPPPATTSDFAPQPTTAPQPSTPTISLAQLQGITDDQIGNAIQHGVDFLLSQFSDGEISPDTVLSDSQRQALDALCVYALFQSSQSINDPRLSMHGNITPAMLQKLRSYEMVSDGKTTNRPITYGRSLRAAALATFNRDEDRETLKKDVAWLIQNHIDGAYSYDDLYMQLIARGLKPVDQSAGALANNPPPDKNQSPQDFGGSSQPPSPDSGPYDQPTQTPGSSPYNPPPGIGVSLGGGGGLNGGQMAPLPTGGEPSKPRPSLAPFPRTYMPAPPPPPPPHQGPIGTPTGGTYVPPAVNDGIDAKVPPTMFIFPWDNSNSQYGLLGVWAGAEVGMEVPDSYWKAVEHHWVSSQLRTGEWSYRRSDQNGYYAMTCAGVASLLVTHDYLDVPMRKGAMGRPPYSISLAAGLSWLDQQDNGVNIPNPNTHYLGYDLFGIERVGLASGFKYFGSHDWYRELAARIVPLQFANGAWGHEDHGLDCVVDTAYTLLFLSRGRHPVMMTKLKFDKYWDNRPRDIANLARFAGKELERPLNWQVVGINHDWSDWFDSPVLYIASQQPPQFKEEDYRRLRSFVLAGGLIFTQADGASAAFNAWVPELAKQIAPDYPLKPLPENSPIYSIQYKLSPQPALLGVSNGARLLLIHCPSDLAIHWQDRATKTYRWAFELGSNVFLYASGKPELRNRLSSPYLPPAPNPPADKRSIALLEYAGNSNPEPAAWYRFARFMQWETGIGITPQPMPIESLTPNAAPIAALTGTDAIKLSAVQTEALHSYVESGGILLIDSCGGENAFTRSIRDELLPQQFADATEQPLPPDHPLFKGLSRGQSNASPLRLRPFAIDRLGALAPQIRLLKLGRGYILFSPLDLTSGLLGTHTWGILGYEPSSAQTFLKNLVQWSRS